MSSPVASASPATDRRLRGYAEIGVAALILGTSATLIQMATMPASLLVVLRMALAGIVLAALFLKTGGIAEVRRADHHRWCARGRLRPGRDRARAVSGLAVGGVPIGAVSDTLLEGAAPVGAPAERRRPLTSSSSFPARRRRAGAG
jgi:hypothetical protein